MHASATSPPWSGYNRSMRAVALTLIVALAGCFSNPQQRTYAKIGEGVLVVGGIVMLASVNSGADCEIGIGGMTDQDCKDKASLLSNIGLGLILTGLVGFIITVSTSDDDSKNTSSTAPKQPAADPATPAPAPAEPTPAPAPAP